MINPSITEAVVPPIADLSVSPPPDTTTAQITDNSPLGIPWVVASQVALRDGTPLSRTYSQVSLADGPALLDHVQLGYYDATYKGSSYYQLSKPLIEEEWYSPDFTTWEHRTNHHYLVTTYSEEVLATLTWTRPTVGTPPDTVQLAPLNNPYSVSFDGGPAVAALISTDAPSYTTNLIMGNNPPRAVSGSPILLVAPVLQVVMSTTDSLPTHLTVTFLGKELWRLVQPSLLDMNPTVHVPQGDPRRPPTLQGATTAFWNSVSSLPVYSSSSSQPSIIAP